MSRRLSNIEWAMFQREVNVDKMDLPPWGGIIQWHGQSILAYRPTSECNWMADLLGTCPAGELFLSDVSDIGDLDGRFPKGYDPYAETWWYQLPSEAMEVTAKTVADAGNLVAATGEVIGKTAGAIAAPLVESLTVPLIIAGVLGIVLLAKR